MTLRTLTHMISAGLLAAGVVLAGGAPALAADGADLGIGIKGTTISWGDASKPATVTITNHGTTTPATARIRFDPTGLTGPAGLLFSFGKPSGSGCDFYTAVKVCELAADQIPAPGKTLDLDLWLYNGNNQDPGPQGTLVAQVVTEGDVDAANDTARVEVAMSPARGPDLRVLAEDVTSLTGKGEPLQPGETSALFATAVNNGSEAATDVEFRITLPEQVTFAKQFDDCTYDADLSAATCDLGDVVLTDEDAPGSYPHGVHLTFPVTLSADATGPAKLSGGVITGTGKYFDLNAGLRARSVTELPAYAEVVDPSKVTDEVDASDNSDTFAALVAGPAGGSGGGSGDDDPGLPVTGPVAASAAAAGAAILLAGVALFLMARRRRVVLVTPDDER